MQTSNL